MSYSNEADMNQILGVGSLGEVRQGPDGNLYQWMEGVDGLGNPIGFWKSLRRFVRRALPIAQRLAPFIPGASAALTAATPFLKQAGVAGLGALYQAPDGAVYQQIQGPADELQGPGEEELSSAMGIGDLGNLSQAPDGTLYQWVEGVDGLGNSIGFWRALRRGLRSIVRSALPLANQFAPFIPGGAAALTAATPFLKQAGIAGQGLAADEDLRGLANDPDLQGLEDDDVLHGLDDDDELRGFGEDQEIHGLHEDEALRGVAEEQELHAPPEEQDLHGLEAYVTQDPNLNGFVPAERSGTPLRTSPPQPSRVWKPLW